MQRANNFFKSTKPRREHAIALFVACNGHGEDKRRRGTVRRGAFALLFNLSWQTQRRKAECFYGIFLEVQKSQTDFKGRARRKHDTRKEIFRAQSAVANTAMI